MLENKLYDAVAVIEPQGLRGLILNAARPDILMLQIREPSDLSWKGRGSDFDQGSLEFLALDGQKTQIIIGNLPEGRRLPTNV